MNREVRDRWVAALRSGDYAQGARALAYRESVSTELRYCCLGVLCDLASRDGVVGFGELLTGRLAYGAEQRTGGLPTEVIRWAGLDDDDPVVAGRPLSSWNDGTDGGSNRVPATNFATIAQLIEGHL